MWRQLMQVGLSLLVTLLSFFFVGGTSSSDWSTQAFVSSGENQIWSNGIPPRGFVKKFAASATSLFAGSLSEVGSADGPVLDARFFNLTEMNTVNDGVQRKLETESWNRFYVMDRSVVRMIHPCAEDIASMMPGPYTLKQVATLPGVPTGANPVQPVHMMLSPDASSIYISAINETGYTGLRKYSYPGMAVQEQSPHNTFIEGLGVRADGTLFYATYSADFTNFEIRKGTINSYSVILSLPASLRELQLCYSSYDDRIYLVYDEPAHFFLRRVHPDTGAMVEINATANVGPYPPVVTADGGIWFSSSSIGTALRYDVISETSQSPSYANNNISSYIPRPDGTAWYHRITDFSATYAPGSLTSVALSTIPDHEVAFGEHPRAVGWTPDREIVVFGYLTFSQPTSSIYEISRREL
jgi:hypothetical protein